MKDGLNQGYVTISFGGVTIQARKLTRAQRKLRLAESAQALRLLAKVLSKPGVKLTLDESLPSYVADKRDPSLVVEKCGKISRRGYFNSEGLFVAVDR